MSPAGSQAQQDIFSFDVINTLQSPTSVDLLITAQGLPPDAQLWLHPLALAGRWSVAGRTERRSRRPAAG